MLLFEQLDFFFRNRSRRAEKTATTPQRRAPTSRKSDAKRDSALEGQAHILIEALGLPDLIPLLRVEWNPRLRSAAGRADFHRKLISLNPRLHEHGAAEIDRTLRHELAHLIAHWRAGRRRIDPHGPEWRKACRDLGIADEQRCHTLPFPVQRRRRPFLYRCPKCAQDFPRVRKIRRSVACLACCRRHTRGQYDQRFRLQLIEPNAGAG